VGKSAGARLSIGRPKLLFSKPGSLIVLDSRRLRPSITRDRDQTNSDRSSRYLHTFWEFPTAVFRYPPDCLQIASEAIDAVTMSRLEGGQEKERVDEVIEGIFLRP